MDQDQGQYIRGPSQRTLDRDHRSRITDYDQSRCHGSCRGVADQNQGQQIRIRDHGTEIKDYKLGSWSNI